MDTKKLDVTLVLGGLDATVTVTVEDTFHQLFNNVTIMEPGDYPDRSVIIDAICRRGKGSDDAAP